MDSITDICYDLQPSKSDRIKSLYIEPLERQIEKLKSENQQYKNKLVDGRMIELPCRDGDEVYTISYDCYKGIKYNPYNENGYSYAELCLKCGTYPCNLHKTVVKNKAESLEWIIKNILNNNFGKTIFLTQEEAEQKLKESEETE